MIWILVAGTLPDRRLVFRRDRGRGLGNLLIQLLDGAIRRLIFSQQLGAAQLQLEQSRFHRFHQLWIVGVANLGGDPLGQRTQLSFQNAYPLRGGGNRYLGLAGLCIRFAHFLKCHVALQSGGGYSLSRPNSIS